MQAECDSWLQGIIAKSPQRLPGRRRSLPSPTQTPLTPTSTQTPLTPTSTQTPLTPTSTQTPLTPTSTQTPLAAQRPPLRTHTPSMKYNSRQATPMQRRNGETTPRTWAERRVGGVVLAKENDPFAVTLRHREEAFEKTIGEWVAWREREMESMRKLEIDLKRRAERISRQEISLIAREQKLKRREASLNLRESELHDKALQQEHKERTNQVVEQIESRGRLQYMENEIQQLKNIVSSIQQNSVSIESSPQQSSVKRKLHRNRTMSNNASLKSQNTVSKEKQQSRGRSSCASTPYRSGK